MANTNTINQDVVSQVIAQAVAGALAGLGAYGMEPINATQVPTVPDPNKTSKASSSSKKTTTNTKKNTSSSPKEKTQPKAKTAKQSSPSEKTDDEITWSVKRVIAILSENGKIRIKLTEMSWNGGAYKYDIRKWVMQEDGTEKPTKGIALTNDEVQALIEGLMKITES